MLFFTAISLGQEPLKAHQRHGSLNWHFEFVCKGTALVQQLRPYTKKNAHVHIHYQLTSPLQPSLSLHQVIFSTSNEQSQLYKSEVMVTNSWPSKLKNDEEATTFSSCGMSFICALCGSQINMREADLDEGKWKERKTSKTHQHLREKGYLTQT